MQSAYYKKRHRFNINQVEEKNNLPSILSKIDSIMKTTTAEGICKCTESLEEQKILSLLSLILGYKCMEDIINVLNVVPNECGPWREELATDMLHLLNSEVNSAVLKVLMRCQTSLLLNKSVDYFDSLQRILIHCADDYDHEGIFAGCLAPPVDACISCGGCLQKSNSPSLVTLFTIKGPVPLKKSSFGVDHVVSVMELINLEAKKRDMSSMHLWDQLLKHQTVLILIDLS